MYVPICVCISWAKNSNLHKPEEPTIFDVSKSLFRKSTKILESHFLKHPVNFTISFPSKPQNTVKKLKRKSLRGECQFQSFKIQLLLRWFRSNLNKSISILKFHLNKNHSRKIPTIIQLLFPNLIWLNSQDEASEVSFKTFYGKFKIILIIGTHNFPSSFKMNFFSDKLPN